jgi:hypothetical protein
MANLELYAICSNKRNSRGCATQKLIDGEFLFFVARILKYSIL